MTTTIYQPWADYTADGVTKRYTFGFPYLARTHIMVTRDGGAPALFKFIDDHTVEIYTLFGDPIPKDEPLKIFRQTPDLNAFAEFKDGALMTGADLNRARLQLLFLIQERSGGLAGAVSTVVTSLTNEIETLSGALDSLQYSQGQLSAGLQTLGDLGTRMSSVEDGQSALQNLIDETIQNVDASNQTLTQRVDQVEVKQDNLTSSVASQIATLAGNDEAFASRIDSVEAKVDAIDTSGGDDAPNDDVIAASIITSTIAEAKSHYSQAKQLETLSAQFGDVNALIQTEQTARADADSALAQQITQLQTQIGDNLSQVIEQMQSKIDLVDGRVSTVEANYSLKVMAQRQDGRQVMAGIGLNATASDDYTGSEIVMAAERLLFADSSDPDGALKPMFTAGSVDGSPTFVIPSNVMGDRLYPGRLLVDGSIEGRSIAANTITGDKLTAGSIDTDKLTVGIGANLLQFSEFVEGSRGWTLGVASIGAAGQELIVDLAGWTLLGGHTLGLHSTVTNGNTSIATYNVFAYSTPIPVEPGQHYEFSAYCGVHRCTADVGVNWYDVNQALVGSGGFSALESAQVPATGWMGGAALSGYFRAGGIVQAPATATLARLLIRKSLHTTGLADSWCFFTHPMFAATTANATRLKPYTPGGQMTTITPAGISTPSLSAMSAIIGLLRTAGSGQRMELESNQLRVYDSNNVLRVRLGVW